MVAQTPLVLNSASSCHEFNSSSLLQPSIPGALSFLEHMRGLGDRLGPIAQLPASYEPALLDDLQPFVCLVVRHHWPEVMS